MAIGADATLWCARSRAAPHHGAIDQSVLAIAIQSGASIARRVRPAGWPARLPRAPRRWPRRRPPSLIRRRSPMQGSDVQPCPRTVRRRRAAGLAAALAVIAPAAIATADDVQPFTVALPTVTGPIPSTSDNFGFGIEGFDVQPPVPDGYVIEEFFVSGVGNLYEFTPTGIRVVSPCPTAATSGCTSIPYTTRMVVKRPKRDRDF